ncbi:hypothetical protein J2T55_002440 [Methylohalomonas lacus]|uniref:Uncharacterized protein n=1 Tax=Methylohalomonas lacus TaxID=398773 RepID=A0AAE3L1Q1_9GAMM|nr:hypothetical protein [Methylohalomonas lacus]MCS3904404.1 hypothetical protein [Methylohalomonas lacus]
MSDDPSPDDLPPEARPAYEAYLAMSETKQAYFSFMVELDEKYKQGGEATIAENLKLEQLLDAHDEQVKAFNKAMADCKNMDAAVRNQLIAAMGGGKPGQ